MMKTTQALIEQEIELARGNKPFEASLAHSARWEMGNFKAAEQRMFLNSSLPRLEIIRTLLARGKLRQVELELSGEIDKTLRTDIQFNIERARLASFEGEWLETLRITKSILLVDEIDSLTRMTCLQIQANAQFELGLLALAINDFEEASAHAEFYPLAPASFYLRLLGCKLYEVLGKSPEAESLFSQLLTFAKSKSVLNADDFVALLRTRSFLDFHQSKSKTPWSKLAYWLASANGDDLYAGLSLFECLSIEHLNALGSGTVQALCLKFRRLESLRQEVIRQAVTYSGKWIQVRLTSQSATSFEELAAPEEIIISEWQVGFSSKNAAVRKINLTQKTRNFLETLQATKSMSRADCFQKVWGLKYSQVRHKHVFSMALKRLDEQSGIRIQSSNQVLTYPSILII